MNRPRALFAIGVLLTVLAAACGISESRPEVLPGGEIRPALSPEAEAASGGPKAGTRPVSIFLVSGSQVVEVSRTTSEPRLEPALELLLQGPTSAELAAGIRSAIATGTELRSARVEAGTAVVDLTQEFVELGGEEQILAVAQLVLTATAVAGVERVRFALNGQDLEVPRADGTLARAPLTAHDYASLVGEAGPPAGP